MKQRDLVKKLEKAGFEFARHGGNHDIYKEGTEKVDYTVYIWYNVSIKYRRCFYDRTTAEIDAKSIHGNI